MDIKMDNQNSTLVDEINNTKIENKNNHEEDHQSESIVNTDIKENNIKDDLDENNSEKEDEWLDILGSGQLMKKIIKKGEEDSRPHRSDVCTVKYVGKLNDKAVDEGLVTINLGDAEVIQGLDFALPLMDLGEEAEIIVGPRFAFGSEGRLPDIPPDSTLHYTVTLVSAQPEPPPESLPLEDRKAIGNRKKERGNYWYSRKDHTLAIQCYRRALEYLDDIGLSSAEESKVTEEEINSLLEDRIKVYNNLAAAQLKIKAFDTALQSIENVLRCQPNNVKALFRKGKVLSEKGETEEAILLLKKTLILEPDNSPAKYELSQLLARKKVDTDQQRQLYKKMLGTNKPKGNDSTSSSREARRWGLVAGCVGAIISMLVAYKYYRPV